MISLSEGQSLVGYACPVPISILSTPGSLHREYSPQVDGLAEGVGIEPKAFPLRSVSNRLHTQCGSPSIVWTPRQDSNLYKPASKAGP